MSTSESYADIATSDSPARSRFVRGVFDDAPHYLSNRRVDIRVRTDIVRSFAGRTQWNRLLDVGCGDGTISVPLVKDGVRATFLDLSSSMTTRVQAKIPKQWIQNVEVKNEEFMSASLERGSFDLIVSVGVMAHVDSPEAFIAKIAGLLRPKGCAIIEFTDCKHLVGRVARCTSNLKELVAPPKYRTNRLSFRIVSKIFGMNRLRLLSQYRYSTFPIPGFQRVISPDMQYRLIKKVFSSAGNNRSAWLGNEYICFVTLD